LRGYRFCDEAALARREQQRDGCEGKRRHIIVMAAKLRADMLAAIEKMPD
jgi:hypothetical protein